MSLDKYLIKDKKVVIATFNKGKVEEFKVLLSNYKLGILTPDKLGIGDVEETGKSFTDNSVLKVKNILSSYIAISDDSGLCIKNLDDNPGIFSARYAKKCGGWHNAMKKLFNESYKKNQQDFEAKFCCSLSIKFTDGKIFSYFGQVYGKIIWPPRGNKGFGYDPFFIPKGQNITYGEMDYSNKIQTDHRSVAFKKLAKAHLKNN